MMREQQATFTALVVTIALVPSVLAARQTAPHPEKEKTPLYVTPEYAAQRLADWTTAVRTHAAGTVDAPLKTVASWRPEHVTLVVRQVVERLHRLLEIRDTNTTPEQKALTDALLRGLSLHTDIAIVQRADLPPRSRGAVVLVDGQITGIVERSPHWPIARQMAAALAPLAGQGPPVAAWYRATAAVMQQWGDCDLLDTHLEAGQMLFPDDPVLALYQGTLRQTLGDPRIQQYVRHGGSAADHGLPPVSSRDRLPPAASRLPKPTKVELGIAERELRRALTLDPTLHEARIRLAHVLGVLGDHRQAADVVRPAVEAPLPPFSAFYAALILGRSEEQLGRFDEAGVAYTRAAARFPGAQSAEIGRSRVALAQGRADDGLKILVDVVGPHSTERRDPWLDYLKRHDPDAATRLKAWREGLK